MWDDIVAEATNDKQEVADFLQRFDLQYDSYSDVTLLIRREGQIAATASLRGRVIQCLAVDEGWRGAGLANKLVDSLLRLAYENGETRLFVFTPSQNASMFASMGFRLLARTNWAALLETGLPSIDDYLSSLRKLSRKRVESVGGLVMNCNPFTLGHQYLVEYAAQRCGHVFLMVVEEESSVFPFRVRLELVKRGTAHLDNVTVLPTGPYAVSLATFPSYFTKENTAHAQAGASIDATLYAKHIAPALGIQHRFIGTEPFSAVTAIYNGTMQQVLREYGIEVVEISRLMSAEQPISASMVRDALRHNDYAQLATLVPESTRNFLLSEQAEPIIDKLKDKWSRH